MSDIFYMKENNRWVELKFRGDLSGLSDVFEFMEDSPVEDKGDFSRLRYRAGTTLTMDYGCMSTLMEKGELVTEDEYDKKRIQDF